MSYITPLGKKKINLWWVIGDDWRGLKSKKTQQRDVLSSSFARRDEDPPGRQRGRCAWSMTRLSMMTISLLRATGTGRSPPR
jgi:hypothetical protein